VKKERGKKGNRNRGVHRRMKNGRKKKVKRN
jgi:hypothetical protein